MKLREWLERYEMTNLKIKTPFLETELRLKNQDRDAAWELYIELLTRTAIQPLRKEHGDEVTALESIYKLFDITREVIKRHGRECTEFAKIAIIILNQKIRPFTSKWHKVAVEGGFKEKSKREEFREELSELQKVLKKYARMLSDIAGVEDLTELEE